MPAASETFDVEVNYIPITLHSRRTVSPPSATGSPVSTTFVHAVANATGREPRDLPPLYEVLNPDALNALVTSRQRGPRHDHNVSELRFRYAGVDVRVRENGDVDVEVDGSEA